MSSLEKKEYIIKPEESFTVIHNCAGCGRKERFVNTKRFRVNANGNNLDVWLIYQCEKCKHTLNIPIYERVDKRRIPMEEYLLFLKNDEELAEQYGMNCPFFKGNRLEIDWENVAYSVEPVCQHEDSMSHREADAKESRAAEESGQDRIIIHNPHGIRIRPEKLVGIVFNISRSMVKKMINQKQIIVCQEGAKLEIVICACN